MSNTYFNFARYERWGLIILLFLALVLFVWPFLYPFFWTAPLPDAPRYAAESKAFSEQLAVLEQEEDKYKSFAKSYDNNYPKYKKFDNNNNNKSNNEENTAISPAELFVFNPNTASKEEFIKLGLSQKVAYSILNYREKGGQFRIKTDLAKIYTLSQPDFERLQPYIDLPDTKMATTPADSSKKIYNNNFNNNSNNNNNFANNANGLDPNFIPKYSPTAKNNSVILDINQAQAADFQQLSGVGAGYANRIVKYKETLGGFVRIEQVGEVYGLPDSVFQRIKANLSCPNPQPKRINVNTATAEELKHPYLSFGQAKAIVRYREQQGGRVKNLDYLQTILALDDGKNTAIRIRPYLKLD